MLEGDNTGVGSQDDGTDRASLTKIYALLISISYLSDEGQGHEARFRDSPNGMYYLGSFLPSFLTSPQTKSSRVLHHVATTATLGESLSDNDNGAHNKDTSRPILRGMTTTTTKS